MTAGNIGFSSCSLNALIATASFCWVAGLVEGACCFFKAVYVPLLDGKLSN